MSTETIERDVREIRAGVQKLSTNGCAHKTTHEKNVESLWVAREKDREETKTMFVKTILLVLAIVLGAMVANIFSTAAVVERVMDKAVATISHQSVQPPAQPSAK